MTTTHDTLDLFGIRVNKSLSLFVSLFLFSFAFCFDLFCFFFKNRKGEERYIETRGELWRLHRKLSAVILVGHVKLIRIPQWHTNDRLIEVHYCSVWFEQAQSVISVLYVVIGSCLFAFFKWNTLMPREAATTSSANVLEFLFWPGNWLFFHVSIEKVRAFKRGKETQTKAVYLLDKLHMKSIVTPQSQKLVIFETWNSTINIWLLNAFVLNWTLKAYRDIRIHRQRYFRKTVCYLTTEYGVCSKVQNYIHDIDKSLRGRSGFHIDIHSSVSKYPLKIVINECISFPRLFHTGRFVSFKFFEKRIHQIWWVYSLTSDMAGGLKLKIMFSCTRIRCIVRNSKKSGAFHWHIGQDIYTKRNNNNNNKNNMLTYISPLIFWPLYFNAVKKK